MREVVYSVSRWFVAGTVTPHKCSSDFTTFKVVLVRWNR